MTQENCINEINRHIDLINEALTWGDEFRDGDFPGKSFKKWRRELKKMRDSLESKCSAAAYGESQVGKSYLMSSLLSSPGVEFKIMGNDREYDFKSEINSSASYNGQKESTGIVTRFTAAGPTPLGPKGMVRIKNLSVVDIIQMLVDSYYNDIKRDAENDLDANDINEALRNMSDLWQDRSRTYDYLEEDDIWEIQEYVKDIIGSKASAVVKSKFADIIAPVIKYVPVGKWSNIFEFLWNRNPDITRLFETLINAYDHIKFQKEVFIPFDAVLWKNGTILEVDWLNMVSAGNDANIDLPNPTVDVYDRNGELLAKDFPKGELSALIAELTFEVPEKYTRERVFFEKMDLLDFPGARSRKSVEENELEGGIIGQVLRRGKVAYLFNKYSRDKQISSLLFCHHNDQTATGGTIGDTVRKWLNNNIGDNPQKRTKMISATNGISPLFFIATKFNMDLDKLAVDKPDNLPVLDNHWKRFDSNIPEVLGNAPWLEKWSVTPSGVEIPFRHIFPLRDFEFSKKAGLFTGYTPEHPAESGEGEYSDFPGYLKELRNSFIHNPDVIKYFKDPEKSWEEFATVNNDGSKPIIRALSDISDTLDRARYEKYLERILEIRQSMLSRLENYYESADPEAKNRKVKNVSGLIRQDLTRIVSKNPVAFGKIMEKFMVEPEDLRNIAYDIIIRHTESPAQYSQTDWILHNMGIDITKESRESVIAKMMDEFSFESEKRVREYLAEDGINLDDLFSNRKRTITEISELVAYRIVEYWSAHLDEVTSLLVKQMPHASEIVDMLKNLFTKVEMLPRMTERIKHYTKLFSPEEQPNVIGDYASLTLNKFVTSVGREFIDDSLIEELQEKALRCNIRVNCAPKGWDRVRKRQSLSDTLEILDQYATIINNPGAKSELLNQLPFWSNYQRWENFLMMGLLYSSDISQTDPVANGRMGEIINKTESLYQ